MLVQRSFPSKKRILRCGLNMVTITSVGEYSKERFSKEDALSQYLIPYVYSKDLDAHAEKFLKKYCPKAFVFT